MPYTLFAIVVYLMTCVIVLPTLIIMSQRKSWHPAALRFHEWWAHVYFSIIFMPVEIVGKEKLEKNGQYIFCCNHFSFLDIPAFYLLYNPKFIGKRSLTKIPLFGYFFKKIHIPVDRTSPRSRAESFHKSEQAIREGYSLAFFPEGGIVVKEKDLPYMNSFKDGAFRLAIEKQVALVPLTMPNNFLILADKSPIRFRRLSLKIIVHDPIPAGMYTEATLPAFKKHVYEEIQSELLKHHPDKVRPVV
ncbi:MAG: 1-acyl-sn-glycerol-3-phosphate acyltransferase [Marinoscillum sp.]|jgi:1-acyl-sn-glycerol-3-phosphate acyltransferase